MKKIIVTGGAGFIGSNFVRMLLKKKARQKVTVLDKLTYAGNLDNISDLMKDRRLEFIKGDICNARLLDSILPGTDIIYNFAAETHVDRSILEAGSFVKTDVVGTYTLLQKTLKYSIPRFVQISTDEVYGSILKGKFRETDPMLPNSPYSASKAAADMLVRSFHKTYGLPAVITRSSNNYGPNQHPEKFIPLFLTNAIEGKPLPLYGDGKNIRDWVYVEDNCRAIELVGRSGKTGEIYNIGAGEEKTNLYIARKIIEITGADKSLLTLISDRPGHDRRYAVCTRKISRLGWKKKVGFSEGMQKTARWYIDNEKWWKSIKEGAFKRYYSRMYSRRIDTSVKKGTE
ncbi:MAG: dTDP-glucose 4,6-dehydratase [Candidatus Krumholzibacteriota bacterium]|nr:dTDP-glucose 4,6-dehydratase [Candidatus Krumholzibacteriota bacterium]